MPAPSTPIRATAAPKVSLKKKVTSLPSAPQPGMGAVPHAAGTTFRVWAPHADAVSVVGTFNDWKPTKHPLQHEADGYWAVDVPDARPGDEYKYHIRHNGNAFDRNDPYARQVTNSAGSSVVHDPHFDWGDDNFQMPPWNEPGDLRAARGHLQRPPCRPRGHLSGRGREAAVPARFGHQLH
ncbi:hypothetical protein ACFQT0_13155 [Hymenobacter humi]|uniref:Glycoside hydrolase family 13 N-terminal domain-containing protein n=1 Tax=Hymenobacter humi TaxID=1411620 RepID=A0ABW2U414_9BACT